MRLRGLTGSGFQFGRLQMGRLCPSISVSGFSWLWAAPGRGARGSGGRCVPTPQKCPAPPRHGVSVCCCRPRCESPAAPRPPKRAGSSDRPSCACAGMICGGLIYSFPHRDGDRLFRLHFGEVSQAFAQFSCGVCLPAGS